MKIGITLHPDRGIDAIMAEAQAADEQGYDSVWLFDHLMAFNSPVHTPDGPFENFTLMTAIGAATKRTRLAWAMLNVGFRHPAVLAKMLATLDHVTKGRVICALGSGWFKEEYEAYNLPLIDDHDQRAEYAREVVALIKELWTHPAPERVTFEGKHVKTKELPFNPAPYQKPHPPIWFGGDSEATLRTVRAYADGWVLLRSSRADVEAAIASPEWPQRPMTLVRNARIYVGADHDDAVAIATQEYELSKASGAPGLPETVGEFLQNEIVGSADEVLPRVLDFESWGINYLRVNFQTPEGQEKLAAHLLPLLAEPVVAGA
jgi:alkanesulfonate monooxygenase SsuD/methylene tetrahydromethanopterin reductase-like flavin-dependent oxidoreductase (luciferase family)